MLKSTGVSATDNLFFSEKIAVPFIPTLKLLFMKKLLFLLLTCGICVSAFAQKEKSDKWIITADAKIKKGFGRLDMNFPDSVYWWVIIYDKDDKMVKSFYPHEKIKSYNLLPGQYRIELSNVKVENVPIEAGHSTRLRSGTTKIESGGEYWQLYDADKENFFTSSSLFDGNAYQLFESSRKISNGDRKSLNLALPVRNYTWRVGGDDKIITVKETVLNASPPNEIIDAEQYSLVPVTGGQRPPSGTGRLMLPPKQIVPVFTTFIDVIIYPAGVNVGDVESTYKCGTPAVNCPPSCTIPEGTYDIYLRGFYNDNTMGFVSCSNCSDFIIRNVPVRNDYETRLKIGYLKHFAHGLYQVCDESMQHGYLRYISESEAPLPWPAGKFRLKLFFVGDFPIQITDGKTTIVNPVSPKLIPQVKWTMKPVFKPGKPLSAKSGRLNTSFPEADNLGMYIHVPKAGGNGYTSIDLDTLKSIDLPEGNYTVIMNGLRLELPIKAGQETKIRFGYLTIKGDGEHDCSLYENKLSVGSFNSVIESRVIALPVDYYRVLMNSRFYLIKITEGEILVFDLQNPS